MGAWLQRIWTVVLVSVLTLTGCTRDPINSPYETSLNPVMRVGDQILETLTAHTALHGSAARARVIEWLRRVGIPDPERRIYDYPFQFSGGQKQCVMTAIALAAEPTLLIADEPSTALDVTVQAQVLDLLADIQRDMGMAILLITHDLAVVRNVAQHVALMRAGEIVESASAETFFANPKHQYARQLFNAIPTYEKRGRPLAASVTPALNATSTRATESPRPVGDVCSMSRGCSSITWCARGSSTVSIHGGGPSTVSLSRCGPGRHWHCWASRVAARRPLAKRCCA